MMTIKNIIHRMAFLFLGIGALAACSSTDPSVEDDHVVRMPVNLFIPATDASLVGTGNAGAKATRAEGDPGTYEKFKLPTYSYIYIITKDDNDKDFVTLSTNQLKGTWKKERYEGSLATANDSVYRYEGYIDVYLPDKRKPQGAVYAALSAVELPDLPTGNESTVNSYTGEDVKNFQFTMNDDIQKEIQNIYSTPYNYTINSTYYGTLYNMNTVNPSINIVLYHIASKLDVQWNVASDIQSSVRLTNLTLTTPQPKECYIFKPLMNKATSTQTHVESIGLDAGSQWYGRAYRYVIPVVGSDGNYTFTMTLSNGSSANAKSNTISAGAINTSQPFTPWMLGTISVKTW